MNVGDIVTGVPNPIIARKYPTVTGGYYYKNVERPGGTFMLEFVVIGDGTYIDIHDPRPANRREKITAEIKDV